MICGEICCLPQRGGVLLVDLANRSAQTVPQLLCCSLVHAGLLPKRLDGEILPD
jgi:hypothetical protein